MHRIQIYLEEPFFEQIRMEANRMGLSISAYIRDVVQRDLTQKRSRQSSDDFPSLSACGRIVTLPSTQFAKRPGNNLKPQIFYPPDLMLL